MNWDEALLLAVEEAELFRGATSPNPPVGAVALDASGELLAVAAHHRAGELHAERMLFADLERQGLLHRVHTVVVTLEPCRHFGRTPPCTDAIFAAGVKRVIFGLRDPHAPASGGEQVLRDAGLEVLCLEDFPQGEALQAVRRQLGPFMKRVLRGRPWVTVKRALTEGGSMLPPPGLKTFTSLQSLRLAHLLRRRADAILTGSGTILADQPEFTVRHLQDHVRGPRQLIIADRSGRVSQQASHYLEQARQRGFEVVITTDWRSEMARLSERGVMEILVEAGPSLSADVLAHEDWDEHWVIQKTAGEEDQVTCIYRESLKS